jgi:hypothetical protein
VHVTVTTAIGASDQPLVVARIAGEDDVADYELMFADLGSSVAR